MAETPTTRKLTRGEIIAYAFGVWPLTLPAGSLTLSTTYYSAALGLPLSTLALALSAGRVFDMIADVVMGYISDNIRTRFGQRRPWIIAGTVLLIPAVWMVLVPGPGFSSQRYAIGLIFYFSAWTMAMVPFLAHGTELTTDFADRSRINVANGAVGVMAILFSFCVPYIVVDRRTYELRAGLGDWYGGLRLPGSRDVSAFLHTAPISGIASYGRVMLTVVIITTITAPLCALFYGCKVPDGIAQRPHASRQPILTAIKNPVFMRFSIGYMMIMTGYFGRFGLMAFIAALLFQSPDLLLPIYIVMFSTAWLVTPLWAQLVKRLERHVCVALAAGIEVFALGVLIVAPKGAGHDEMLLLSALVMGLPGQVLVTLPFLIAAECSEYSDWKTGREARALHISLTSLIVKLGSVAAALQLTAASLMGFDPGHRPTDMQARSVLEILGLLVPMVLMSGGSAIVMTHPLTRRRTRQIQAALVRRNRLFGGAF